jgi:hypothetical protein
MNTHDFHSLEFSGNKRFRFLISFNLDRYQRVNGRRQKSKVIRSIVDQMMYAGCRFLKKCEEPSDHVWNENNMNNDRWHIIIPKEIRLKVSHALRDNRQTYNHEAALARLKVRIEVHDDTSGMLKDSHYIAANAMILNVKLTGRESETLIKALLCDAIDSVGVSTDEDFDREHEANPYVISSNDGTMNGWIPNQISSSNGNVCTNVSTLD